MSSEEDDGDDYDEYAKAAPEPIEADSVSSLPNLSGKSLDETLGNKFICKDINKHLLQSNLPVFLNTRMINRLPF